MHLVPNSNGEDASPVREFNHCHAPGGSSTGGQFCGGEGEGKSTYVRPKVYKVATVEEAVTRILKGETVELRDVQQVNTVLTTLAAMAAEAKRQGKDAPDYDLCKVSVPGTNLFCGSKVTSKEFPRGIPRIKMPQMSGIPIKGSPADALPKDKHGGVDGADAFVEHMRRLGIAVAKPEKVSAASLKASQSQLVGPKVAEMMERAATGYDPGKKTIFVSRDNYIVDGHHRWAAVVGLDAADGHLGNSRIRVIRIDAPISEVLKIARAWSKEFGVSAKIGTSAQRRAG